MSKGDIKKFRQQLNQLDIGESKHRHFKCQQRTRLYGDYLYFQDRDKFDYEMQEWIAKGRQRKEGKV